MTRPTSLLLVSTTLDTGGAQRFASTLLAHLHREQVKPELVLLRNEIGYHLPDDIRVHQLGYRGPWSVPRTAQRLRKVIRQRSPDVVLSNITATNVVTGLALPRSGKIPRWIARVGSSPKYYDSFFRSWGAYYTYPRADHIVANSEGLANELRSRFAKSSDKVLMLPNPTDFTELDRQAGDQPSYTRSGQHPLLVAVGRMVREKRYDVMLDAFAIVRGQLHAELWICGEGPQRAHLERRIRSLGLTQDVRLLGFCRNPHALLAQADLFVMTSDTEGSPNALIEAHGVGLPAVATRCPHGPEEIIEQGTTGLLTPTNDPRKFAEAVLSLLSDPSTRGTMREQARRITRSRFDSQRLCRRWSDLIRRGTSAESGPTRELTDACQGATQ